jgi:hypothetical protein
MEAVVRKTMSKVSQVTLSRVPVELETYFQPCNVVSLQ